MAIRSTSTTASARTVLYKEQLTKVQQLNYSESDNPATGMTDFHTDRLRLRVFPNPTASTLTVEGVFAKEGQLRLYNRQGLLLKTETVGGGCTTLDVSDLPAGSISCSVKAMRLR